MKIKAALDRMQMKFKEMEGEHYLSSFITLSDMRHLFGDEYQDKILSKYALSSSLYDYLIFEEGGDIYYIRVKKVLNDEGYRIMDNNVGPLYQTLDYTTYLSLEKKKKRIENDVKLIDKIGKNDKFRMKKMFEDCGDD